MPSASIDLAEGLSWIEDVVVVGDSFEGPLLVLDDGRVIEHEVPES